MKSIVVFCGSSEGNDPEVISKGYELGKTLALKGIDLIYGAGKIGIMGRVAKGALDNKGKVIGVIPEFLMLKEVAHLGLTELHSTENMHQRKLMMHELSDGILTLPGGFGTLEELFEMITWAQLGLHQKPVGILNINGFFDDLLSFLKNMVDKGFLKEENYKMLLIDQDIDNLLVKMKNYKPIATPKWISNDLI